MRAWHSVCTRRISNNNARLFSRSQPLAPLAWSLNWHWLTLPCGQYLLADLKVLPISYSLASCRVSHTGSSSELLSSLRATLRLGKSKLPCALQAKEDEKLANELHLREQAAAQQEEAEAEQRRTVDQDVAVRLGDGTAVRKRAAPARFEANFDPTYPRARKRTSVSAAAPFVFAMLLVVTT